MEEEEEICRVCRSEATAEQPLFYPCKCSGSIRYVHQDCLIEWLSHSRKKYCELCEHPFTFTPVYRQDMPEVLPAKLFLVQIKKKFTVGISFVLRGILVSSIWLILLPYFTVWIWRFYFFLGSNLSKYLSKLQDMKHQLEFSKNLTSVFSTMSASTALSSSSNSSTSSLTWFQEYKSQLTLQTFLTDCFEGQIIACIVVVIFVAVFLLREWIVQNIPMENPVIEEEIPQQQQNNELEPLMNQHNDQRFDSLFDLHANQQPTIDETPPSPVAVNGQIWYNNDESQPSTSFNFKSTRATSMPPSLSSSSSFQNDETNNDEEDYRRSASMDPYIHTNVNSPNTLNDARSDHPPNAPRMRHADAPVPPIPNIAEEHDEAGDDDEEDDENMEEFEGILEAIGMQGSLWSLAQNCALMALLIALSLGAAVWMPYLIGMLFIISETLDLIRIPLKLARFVTDPLVDLIVFICTDYVSPWMTRLYQEHLAHQIPAHILMATFGQLKNTSNTTSTANDTMTSTLSNFINATKPFLEDAFHRYQGLATGDTATDRFACISVGYIIVTIVSCWYLARSTNNNMPAAAFGRTTQEALRHQGIIFKVGVFIVIELVLFPIVCGILLDLTTLPLFKTATLFGRVAYLTKHPVPSLFLHWFLGTGFMFLFAVLVTLCREVVRPGVMWFIRDPNDPQFHPIREIVERPILFQFKKIGASAIIYITVIILGVGGAVHFVDHFIPILPLNLDLARPLSVIPIDIIAVQVGIPAIMNYLKPKQRLKQLFVGWMSLTCRHLRLTSFIFGGRHPEEEGNLVYHSWSAWIRQLKPSHYPAEGTIDNIVERDVSFIWAGRLLCVPRHDSVPIIEERRMLVPLDNYTLEPLDDSERQLGHPAATAPGGQEANTVIVYSPPRFKFRVVFFMGFMWLSIIVFACAVTIIPVLLGRWILGDIHDIYAFTTGWLTLLGLGIVANQVVASATDIFDQSTMYDTIKSFAGHTKQWGSWMTRWVFFIISFGFIVPVSLGMLIQLYFVIPLQKFGEEAPSIAVLPTWAQGFATMILIHGFIQLLPNNSFRTTINDIFQDGIHQMKLKLCIQKLVGPIVLVSLSATFLPFITAYIHMQILARNNRELRIKLLQITYPISLVGIATYCLGKLGSTVGTRLAQSIREDNYLVGRTLHNLEQ